MSKNILLGCLFTALAFIMPSAVSAETNKGWETIVSKMQNSVINYDVTVADDNSKMIVKSGDVTVTYNRVKDIVTFTSNNTSNNYEYAQMEDVINLVFFDALAEYYGYDEKAFFEWLGSVDPTTLSVENDGLEFTTYTVEKNVNGEKKTVKTMKNFTANIECGVSAFHNVETPEPEEPVVTPEPEEPVVTPEPEKPVVTPEPEEPVVTPEPEEPIVEEKVDNPPTGLYISVAALLVAFIGFVTFGLSKKKNYFSKI